MNIATLAIHLHADLIHNAVILMALRHAHVYQLISDLFQTVVQNVSSILSARAIKLALMKNVEILARALADRMQDAT